MTIEDNLVAGRVVGRATVLWVRCASEELLGGIEHDCGLASTTKAIDTHATLHVQRSMYAVIVLVWLVVRKRKVPAVHTSELALKMLPFITIEH